MPSSTSKDIDAARGLAALGVIWGHAIYGLRYPLELNGAFWVWIFLPISGYLVARGMHYGAYSGPSGLAAFLWNRSLRIVPLAWLALTFGAVAIIAGGLTMPDEAWRQFVFAAPRNDMSLIGPLWTVAAEIQFYLVAIAIVAAAAALWRITGAVGVIALGVAVFAAAPRLIALAHDNTAQPRTLLGNLAFFVAGVAMAFPVRPALPVPNAIRAAMVTAAIVTAWWLNNFRPDYFWAWGPYAGYPFGGAVACAMVVVMVALLTHGDDTDSAVRPLRALEWCGFYTYGIYVYHSMLSVVDAHFLQLSPGPGRLMFLMLAVPIAPAGYRIFERPWLALKRGGRAPRIEPIERRRRAGSGH